MGAAGKRKRSCGSIADEFVAFFCNAGVVIASINIVVAGCSDAVANAGAEFGSAAPGEFKIFFSAVLFFAVIRFGHGAAQERASDLRGAARR